MRKQRIVPCPACAAPVEFKLSTALVTVCDHCRSVVARGDKKLEDATKVADLLETTSPIERGASGKYNKKHFEVVGRVQYQHPAGGTWNEWYLLFPGDKVGWLAEAQGKFYLMFEKHFAEKVKLPSFDSLEIGHRFEVPGGGGYTVAEKGIATARAAEGDIPWSFHQYAEHRFADLHGDNSEFASLEFGKAGTRGFFGHEVALADLNLQGSGLGGAPPVPGSGGLQVNCPQCAGPLTLHAPDQSLRITCPSCKGLLDCEAGNLKFLKTLKQAVTQPLIPLGSVGKLFDVDYTLIGFMVRFAVWEGKTFPWTEYLLYNPAKGFRWLVRNEGHWSFVESVPLSKLKKQVVNAGVDYNGRHFKLYDQGTAHVRFVAGEFYWRVTTDESVQTEDFIAPPYMISYETTRGLKGQEINTSLATYINVEEVEAAFKLTDLPRPFGVGTIQPNPSRADIWGMWVCVASLLALLDFVFVSGAVKPSVDQGHFFTAQMLALAFPLGTLFMRHTFEVNRWSNSDYSPYAQSE